MEITTDMIKELRAATNAGVLDCRKALTEANGDFQKAVDWLREKGMATAAKRADRDASQGVVELYSHGGGRVGVMVEVNCETDFVARSEKFRELAHEIALQIAASAPRYLKAEDIPAKVLDHEAEIARAQADVKTAETRLQLARNHALAEVEAAYAALQTSRELVETFQNELLGQADESRSITIAAYEEGGTELLPVLEAQRTRTEVRQQYFKTLFDYQASIVALELAVGREIQP